MKKVLFIISSVFLLNTNLFGQENNLITVKAGTKVIDNFPFEDRYRYPYFTDGYLIFKNKKVSSGRFNYNLLLGEMEFIQSQDTLYISNKKEISFIVISQDTFFCDNGYIELIRSGSVKVGLIQNIILKDIQRKGAFGITDRNSSIDSYNSMSVTGKIYELIPNEDWVFQKTAEYYFSTPAKGFVRFSKKNVFVIFAQDKDAIKHFLKSNKINFDSREDLFQLADYLVRLLSEGA